MFLVQDDAKIIFYSKPINLIKGIDGLTGIVQSELGIEPDSKTYFLFTNVKKNRFKILYKDGANLAIWFKRFEGTLKFRYSGEIIFFDKSSFLDFLSKTVSRSYRRVEK